MGDLIAPVNEFGYVIDVGRFRDEGAGRQYIREARKNDADASREPVLVLTPLVGGGWDVITGGTRATLTAITASSIGFNRLASMDCSEG